MTLIERLRRRALPLAAAGLVGTVALAGAGPAGAQNPANPAPGCEGLAFEDAEGDQVVNFLPISGAPPAGAPARPNMDVRAGWLNFTTDASGRQTVTANIQVTDLNFETEGAAFGLIYNFHWTDDEGANKYLQAQVIEGNAAFEFGTAGQDGYASEGGTTGKLYPGPMGVISIVLPRGAAGMGKTLAATNATAANAYGSAGAAYFFPTSDSGPDDGQGKDYKVGPCGGGGGTGPSSGGQNPSEQASQFDPRISPTSLKAKKVKRARKVTFTVDARETLKNAKVELRKGSKVLGSFKKATFSKGKVALRLKKKGLKKGLYELIVSGTRANGQAASDTTAIRVK